MSHDQHRISLQDTTIDDFGEGWYAIASSRELRSGRPLAIQRFGLNLVAYRHSEGLSVLLDRCPHRGVALSQGTVRDDRLICPFHGLEFNPEGKCLHIPAHGLDGAVPKAMCVESFEVQEQHGFIFLWWGKRDRAKLTAIDWFNEELQDCYGPYESWAESDTSLSRNIENQLDAMHLPFVHSKSIGRFVKSKQMDIESTVEGQRIRMFQKGRSETFIEVRLPNLWINRIGQNSYVMLAFAPISPTRTRIYTRYYQGQFRIPVLRDLFGWLMAKANLLVLREDLRIIETHDKLISPGLDGSELLLPGDIAIINYRRLRQQWQQTPEEKK